MSSLDNRIPPPVVTLAVGLAMAAGALAAPTYPIPLVIRLAVAGGLLLFAGLVGGGAIAAFGKAKTTINPVHIESASALVTSGAFRITRNPMYLAMVLLLTAEAVIYGRPALLLGPLLFLVFITRFQIVPEERVMQAKFGQAYTAYRARVRRWL
jgi:protein-S-isoprenylcysteine O-methyltransferase Ste14